MLKLRFECGKPVGRRMHLRPQQQRGAFADRTLLMLAGAVAFAGIQGGKHPAAQLVIQEHLRLMIGHFVDLIDQRLDGAPVFIQLEIQQLLQDAPDRLQLTIDQRHVVLSDNDRCSIHRGRCDLCRFMGAAELAEVGKDAFAVSGFPCAVEQILTGAHMRFQACAGRQDDLIQRMAAVPDGCRGLQGGLRKPRNGIGDAGDHARIANGDRFCWLMRQADDALFGTISRLLGDARSEERRMAALDIIKQLADEGTRKALIDRCIPLVTGYDQPNAKEKTLLDSLLAKFGTSARTEEALFTEADVYQPVIEDTPLSVQALQTYMRYFPASEVADMLDGRKKGFVERILQHKGDKLSPVQADLDSLQACYARYAEDLVKDSNGEDALLCNLMMLPVEQGRIVLQESWDAWYAEQVQAPERLMRLHILLCAGADNGAARVIKAAFGKACQQGKLPQQAGTLVHMRQIIAHLMEEHVPAEDRKLLASALLRWLAQCVPDEQLWCEMKGLFGIPLSPLLNDTRLSALLIKLDHRDEAHLRTNFPAGMLLARRFRQAWQKHSSHMVQREDGTVMFSGNGYAGVTTYRSCIEWSLRSGILPDLYHLLHAGYHGLISREGLYAWLMTDGFPRDASRIFGALADGGQQFTSRYAYNYYGGTRFREDCLNRYLGKSKPETDEDAARLKYAADIWAPLLRRIIEVEITRGDTATAYSAFVPGLQRIGGAKNFIAILSALGKDKFARGTFYLSDANGRTESLCRMLSVCVPAPEDTADGLRALVRQYKISDKRLIEAALYSPEWIELVEDAIALPGFRSAAYYFIARMNEECDGIRAARIARFTPLAVEELQNGTFDIGWFRSAWTEVGESAFDMIYDAAKYIISGAKHARARKYADAALGRMETAAAEAEISPNANKNPDPLSIDEWANGGWFRKAYLYDRTYG